MKDKNNTITVYSMLFSFRLEVFSKTLYLLLGTEGIHKSGSFFHLVKLPLHLFEYKQQNIFDYYLKCYDSSVLPHGTESVLGKKNKRTLLSHKMAIATKKKGVLRMIALRVTKAAVWKFLIQTEVKKNLFFRSTVSIPIPNPRAAIACLFGVK